MIHPVQFFKCLSDETRMRCMTLLQLRGELCVCELTQVLQISQPKISRHLALLRSCGLLLDRRQGAWVYYRIHPQLPAWALAVLTGAIEGVNERPEFRMDWENLQSLNGPNRVDYCANTPERAAERFFTNQNLK